MDESTELITQLEEMARPEEVEKVRRFFKGGDTKTKVMGIQIGRIFPVAKKYTHLDLSAVETLLDDERYEVRMAAVAILDFKAQDKALTDQERRSLYDVYLRKHDRLNNWDLVDRAAPRVIGEYLVERDRSILDQLAASNDPNKRRTAIVATRAFLKRGDVTTTFRIAEQLAGDADEYVQKAIASWTREAGKTDENALVKYLGNYKKRLPKSTITSASKLLRPEIRSRLMT